jgi:predicted kinase
MQTTQRIKIVCDDERDDLGHMKPSAERRDHLSCGRYEGSLKEMQELGIKLVAEGYTAVILHCADSTYRNPKARTHLRVSRNVARCRDY